MPELTPEELAALLQKIDDVSRQAQELSAELRKKMSDARRGDQPATSAARPQHRANDGTSRRRRQ